MSPDHSDHFHRAALIKALTDETGVTREQAIRLILVVGPDLPTLIREAQFLRWKQD